jgi:hypothetical protein
MHPGNACRIPLFGVTSFTCAGSALSYQCFWITRRWGEIGGRSQMAAIAKGLSRASRTGVDIETLKTIAVFCGAGLVASLLLAINGLGIDAGF